MEDVNNVSVNGKEPADPVSIWSIAGGSEGRIGYLIAWLLGVPASVLFVIFLIRGH